MTARRTVAWATLVTILAAAVAWTPRPAAGQVPIGAGAGPQAVPGGPSPTSVLEATPTKSGQPAYGPGMMPGGNFGAGASRQQVSQLAHQYVKATGEKEKRDIRTKLSEELGRQFDQLAERQQKELEDLEKQVADLRALLKKRRDARDSIIDRRLDQLVQEAEGLGWGTPGSAPRPQADYPAIRRN
jgi:hypothetical protein